MSQKGSRFLDLRGVTCPENYVRVKLALEEMAPGENLEILLDDGEPMRNVPRSIKDDGYRIIRAERRGGYFSLEVAGSV